jgi:flagellar hook-associated protein 2
MSYTDYDAASLASAMVTAERAGIDEMLSAKYTKYSTQVSGLESLESLLEDFQDSLDTFEDDTSLSAQTTSVSDDDYFSVTSDGTAATGQYNITVKQLAQSYQSAMTFSSSSASIPSSGTFSITVDGETLDVDLSKVTGGTVADLVSYINKSSDNPGVTASLVTSGDSVMLMITSDDTGEDAGVTDMTFTSDDGTTVSVDADGTVTTTGDTSSDSTTLAFQTAMQGVTQLSVAQDAIITLGSNSTIEITSDSNTMEDVIDGLTITLTKAMDSDDDPVTMVVEADSDTVADNLQTWVDSFNSLISSLKELYDDGGDLEGDSTVRSMISSLKTTLRNSLPDGMSLADIGLEFSSDGTLSIDSDALEEALEADPDILNTVFTDDDGIFDAIDDYLEPYTKSNGILASRLESAEDNLESVEERQEKWDTKMENLYYRYLAQFNEMIATMATLESNASLL